MKIRPCDPYSLCLLETVYESILAKNLLSRRLGGVKRYSILKGSSRGRNDLTASLRNYGIGKA